MQISQWLFLLCSQASSPSSISHNQPSLLFFRRPRCAASSFSSSTKSVTCAMTIENPEIVRR
ncbi:hypothetical protein BT93_L0114 [Corymbia citriodora subsp. variegata]|uniref:Uncharacterized protein n=1 Tax=Corymbia citriodora subsp. variegata TaxID=360336 RepID=A0A8T0CQM6_CORYI|nr:hypothetical protein BT93_L0114 [Corymbia citriodora subsp. variegata]